jgi:Na+-driven multidrug efflux pump
VTGRTRRRRQHRPARRHRRHRRADEFFHRRPAALDLAQRPLHIVLWSMVLFGIATTFSGTMRASGTVFAPLAILIFAVVAVELPAAIILGRYVGLKGVWAAYPIAFAAMFILQMRFYLPVWRNRAVTRTI